MVLSLEICAEHLPQDDEPQRQRVGYEDDYTFFIYGAVIVVGYLRSTKQASVDLSAGMTVHTASKIYSFLGPLLFSSSCALRSSLYLPPLS